MLKIAVFGTRARARRVLLLLLLAYQGLREQEE
jgi:hypothetical protein